MDYSVLAGMAVNIIVTLQCNPIGGMLLIGILFAWAAIKLAGKK